MKRQIVIEIDEEEYKYLKNGYFISTSERTGKTLLQKFLTAIYKGTPLPKGYGRLIDADALVKKMEEREKELKDDKSIWETACVETALDMFAPTIIEADKESENE